MKKFFALLLALCLAMTMVASVASAEGGKVYYLNFKPEADAAWQALAKTYTEKTGVQVTVVNPGWVRTEFHERAGIKTSSIPDFIWVESDRVARETLADADKKRVISVPTKRWKLQKALARHAPRSAIRWASRMLSRSRQ